MGRTNEIFRATTLILILIDEVEYTAKRVDGGKWQEDPISSLSSSADPYGHPGSRGAVSGAPTSALGVGWDIAVQTTSHSISAASTISSLKAGCGTHTSVRPRTKHL